MIDTKKSKNIKHLPLTQWVVLMVNSPTFQLQLFLISFQCSAQLRFETGSLPRFQLLFSVDLY